MQKCVERVSRITVLEAHERVETEPAYRRALGYETLRVKFSPL